MGALAIAVVFITLLINAAMILYQLARDIYLWALRIYNYKLGQSTQDSRVNPNVEELEDIEKRNN